MMLLVLQRPSNTNSRGSSNRFNKVNLGSSQFIIIVISTIFFLMPSHYKIAKGLLKPIQVD